LCYLSVVVELLGGRTDDAIRGGVVLVDPVEVDRHQIAFGVGDVELVTDHVDGPFLLCRGVSRVDEELGVCVVELGEPGVVIDSGRRDRRD
jgi:hypothetical protein